MIQFKYHKKSIMVNNHSSLYNEIRGSIYSETRGSVWSETRGSVKNETRGSITVKFPHSHVGINMSRLAVTAIIYYH